MSIPMDRREFLKAGTAVAAGLTASGAAFGQAAASPDDRPVRIGFIGVGGRGQGHVGAKVRK